VVKSLYTMAGIHFKKLPNSDGLQVENCQLKSRTIKCPTIGENIPFKSDQNPPSKPGRGVVGLNFDRCIAPLKLCPTTPVIKFFKVGTWVGI